MTEREALNWEPIREFWRNNSGVNWDELETAIKEALAQPDQEPVPQPQRKPLTDEEIAKAWAQSKGDILMRLKPFARAIEAAHGIKGDT